MICGRHRRVGVHSREQLAEIVIVAMAEDEGLGNGIPKRSDPDLQSSAVGYKARRVQSGGIVCERNWLSWRRKKRKIRTRPIENEIKFARRYLRVVTHEG